MGICNYLLWIGWGLGSFYLTEAWPTNSLKYLVDNKVTKIKIIMYVQQFLMDWQISNQWIDELRVPCTRISSILKSGSLWKFCIEWLFTEGVIIDFLDWGFYTLWQTPLIQGKFSFSWGCHWWLVEKPDICSWFVIITGLSIGWVILEKLTNQDRRYS